MRFFFEGEFFYPYYVVRLNEDNLSQFLEIRNSVRHLLHDSRQFAQEDAISWLRTTKNEYFVFYLEDDVIGYLRATYVSHIECMLGVDVAPRYQGLGHGKAIWKLCLSFLASHSTFESVQLRVLSTNSIALSLYQRLGFRVLTDNGRDIVMTLFLSDYQSDILP